MKNFTSIFAATILIAITGLSAPPATLALAQLTTNANGQIEWIAKTNTPPVATVPMVVRPYLTPDADSRVYTTLLDSHMEAAKRNWIEERLVELVVFALFSDFERATNEAVTRDLRVQLQARDTRIRLQAEVESLRARRRDSVPAAK